MKDPEKRAASGDYRSINCLTTTFKLLIDVVADADQYHLLFPPKQEGSYPKAANWKDDSGKLQEKALQRGVDWLYEYTQLFAA